MPGLHPTPIPTMDTGLGRLYGYPSDEALFAAMDNDPNRQPAPTPAAVQRIRELDQQRRSTGR